MPEIGQKTPDFPHGYGFCQCGCGRRTKLLYFGNYSRYAIATHHPKYKARKLRRFVPAKNLVPKVKRDPAPSVTIGEVVLGFEKGWGYCQCGCGGRTNIYNKGRARRFIVGHSSKTPEFRSAQSLRAAEQARGAGINRDSDHLSLIDKEGVPNKSFQRMA